MPKFSLPKGVQIPEGIAAGDKFQVMATLELSEDGSVELCEVDGNEVAEGREEDEGPKGKGKGKTEDAFVTQVMGYGKGM